MKQELLVQSLGSAVPKTIRSIVTDVVARSSWDRITIAVAYATVAGVRTLLAEFDNLSTPPECRWLLGLDDCLTQPGALRLCMSLPRSSVRVASFADLNARFHPKVMFLSSSIASEQAALIIGSANLTLAGLTRNGETVAIITSDSQQDVTTLAAFIHQVWQMGCDLTDARLRKYERDYLRYSALKKTVLGSRRPSPGSEVLAHDHAEVDPSLASTCWIEVGKNTALGRELEFKAEQALFFGLNPSGGTAQLRHFHLSNGNVTSLRLKYQENSMWRLQMNNDVPEVSTGLRPRVNGRLGRSPYAAVFARLNAASEFNLRFIRVTGAEYRRICKRSDKHGTLGRTSSRQYGWY